MHKKYVVYRIKNKINNRVYFGSTSNFSSRKNSHIKAMMNKDLSKGGAYVRDVIYLNLQPEDFEFRVIARFFNRIEMLQHEQKLLNMYWGTRMCYNHNHEVADGYAPDILITWNMYTLEVRQYMSCHAINKDFSFPKKLITSALKKDLELINGWVIDTWSLKRTIDQYMEMYTRNSINPPPFAFIKDDAFGATLIPGFCSIAALRSRKKLKVWSQGEDGKAIRLLPNWHYEYIYEQYEGALRLEWSRKKIIYNAYKSMNESHEKLDDIREEINFLFEATIARSIYMKDINESYNQYVERWGLPAQIRSYRRRIIV